MFLLCFVLLLLFFFFSLQGDSRDSILPVYLVSGCFHILSCFRWLKEGTSNMAVVDVKLVSGYQVDEDSLKKVYSSKQCFLDQDKKAYLSLETSRNCLSCSHFGSRVWPFLAAGPTRMEANSWIISSFFDRTSS